MVTNILLDTILNNKVRSVVSVEEESTTTTGSLHDLSNRHLRALAASDMIDHMTFVSDASGACTIKAAQREFESTAETKGD